MINDWFVVNAVAHGFNWSPEIECLGPNARMATESHSPYVYELVSRKGSCKW